MSDVPAELKYTKTHEWARLEEDGTVTVGITQHAQDLLGDLVFVEVPEVGAELRVGHEAATVESVKAASDIYAPITGEVSAINEALTSNPELINSDPYGEGWIFKLTPDDEEEINELLDASGYQEQIDSEAH
jgi:glycine cleavage system H protein